MISRILGVALLFIGVALVSGAARAGWLFATPEPLPSLRCGSLSPEQSARSYAIAQIMQSTAIEAVNSSVRARQHHTYLVVPMPTDAGTPFAEWYAKSEQAERWFRRGSNVERPKALGQEVEYLVSFAAQRAPQLIETGADYELPFPIPPRDTYKLNENEDFQSYKNSEDIVCGIKFVLWSTDFKLSLLRVVLIDPKGDEHALPLDGGVGGPDVREYQDAMIKTRHESAFIVDYAEPLAPGYTLGVVYRVDR